MKDQDQNMLVKKKDLTSQLRDELRQSLKLDFRGKNDTPGQSPKSGKSAWREEQAKIQ